MERGEYSFFTAACGSLFQFFFLPRTLRQTYFLSSSILSHPHASSNFLPSWWSDRLQRAPFSLWLSKLQVHRYPVWPLYSSRHRDNVTCQSYNCKCSVSLLNNVLIQQKMQQQWATALHWTHSEVCQCSATKQSVYLQDICTVLQLNNNIIWPVPCVPW
jgi:hypothetical protein